MLNHTHMHNYRHCTWEMVISFWLFLTGSGLHTFVLYLGPHIAFFTIKAMKCGRVDLKFAPYDTIQLKRGPSWLEKDCAQFGPPLYLPSAGSLVKIPVSIILPHVQLEAVLWGIGTALGELPPYFISSAGAISCHMLPKNTLDFLFCFIFTRLSYVNKQIYSLSIQHHFFPFFPHKLSVIGILLTISHIDVDIFLNFFEPWLVLSPIFCFHRGLNTCVNFGGSLSC